MKKINRLELRKIIKESYNTQNPGGSSDIANFMGDDAHPNAQEAFNQGLEDEVEAFGDELITTAKALLGKVGLTGNIKTVKSHTGDYYLGWYPGYLSAGGHILAVSSRGQVSPYSPVDETGDEQIDLKLANLKAQLTQHIGNFNPRI